MGIHAEHKKIGRFISALREERGITQQELAEALETSQSAVARMEKGEQNFSTEMLAKISRVLNREIVTLGSGAVNFKIEGGHKLSGAIRVNTSKNSAVALLCASLLNKNKTTIKNIARIEEVNRIIEVLESMGVEVRWYGSSVEVTPPPSLDLSNVNLESAEKTRSVIMLVGPLAHKLANFKIPHPGGCRLGKRSIRPHAYALSELGIEIETHRGFHNVTAKNLKPAEVIMFESGDTSTENVLMAAALIPGKTVIKYASANYQVQDLCHYLVSLGVSIEGIGTTTLAVHGVKEINVPVSIEPGEDPIEAMLFISLAAATKSRIVIERCPLDFLEVELETLKIMGFKYKILRQYLSDNGFTRLADIRTFPSRLVAPEEKIHARPYPGLNIDNLPFFVPVAAQAAGTTLIHDWVYENRAVYYLELNKLGANVILADPHRVYVEGPAKLKGSEIICPPAIRAASIIMIGMLAAEGTSILRNVYSISRAYEDLCSRLNKIGAKIKVLQSF